MKTKIKYLVSSVQKVVSKLLSNKKGRLLVFVVLFALIGAGLLLFTNAATPTVQFDAEGGALSGCGVSKGQSSDASGGSFVQFGNYNLGSGYEAAKIPNRNQPGPDQVTAEVKLYVSACRGDDTNSGLSQASALKTIRAAVSKINSNTTASSFAIFIESGVYREALGDITKPVIIQPLPGRTVWLSGSDVTSGWAKLPDRNVWQKTISLSNSELCQGCRPAEAIGSSPQDSDRIVTLNDNPAMVFFDSAPLKQVADLASVVANTFAVTKANSTVVTDATTKHDYTFSVGSDPAAKSVEVTTRISATRVKADNVTLRGLGVRNYGSNYNFCLAPCVEATKPAQAGQIVVTNVSGFTLKDSFLGYAATDGITIAGDQTKTNNHTINNNTFNNNGHRGAAPNKTVNLTITQNVFTDNNLEGFRNYTGSYNTAAAIKLTRVKNLVFDSNRMENNNGTGFWCDIGCFNVDITRNISKNNQRHGIYYEISAKANIVSNLLVGNQGYGIEIGGSGDSVDASKGINVYNNTMVANWNNQLRIYQITEAEVANTQRCDPTNLYGVTCLAGNIVVVNNVMTDLGRPQNTKPLALIDGMYRDPADIISVMNYNLYYLDGTCAAAHKIFGWTRSGSSQTACTIGQVQTITGGLETNGRLADTPAKIAFTNDYRLASGNIGIGAGQPFPQALKTLFSWLPTGNPDIGIVN